MKHRELQDYYLKRMFGQDFDEAERVEARLVVDSVINDILGKHDNWPFLRKTSDFTVAAGVNTVALPPDFVSCESVFIGDYEFDVKNPADFARLTKISGRTDVVSIFYNELTGYATHGNVFPVYGSEMVKGISTAWDATVVGRFFQSGRDGELYQIDHVESATKLWLKSTFVGMSQVGRVTVYSDNLNKVYGVPGLHRWTKGMEGKLIWLENNAASRRISSVDEDEQVLTLNSNCDSDDENIIYSIEDSFEIDPAGCYVLNLVELDKGEEREVTIAYRRASTHLASDKDNPVIPFNWHHVIQKGLDVQVAIDDEASTSRIQTLKAIFNEAIEDMIERCVVEFPAADGAVEPEDDPRDFG